MNGWCENRGEEGLIGPDEVGMGSLEWMDSFLVSVGAGQCNCTLTILHPG